MLFRSRGVSMLEIGLLEGSLEQTLRDPNQRDATLNRIAKRVVFALRQGLEQGASLKANCTASASINAACR